jgi:presenilin-like A22 family membrane protease
MPDAPKHHPIAVLPKGDQVSILVHGLAIFACVGGLALLAASKAGLTGGYVPSAAISVPYMLTLFLFTTLLLLLAIKTIKRPAVFETMFTIAMLSGAWFIADIYLPPGLALIVGSAAILIRFAWKSALVMNFSLAVGIAGIAAGIAADLSPNSVLILLTVLSFYDIVAVYSTKHMVKMFRELSSRGVVFAFVLTPLRLGDLLAPAVHPDGAGSEGASPRRLGMFLGTGDVALPVMLAAAALRVGTVPAVCSLAGAAAGFAVMYMLFLAQPKRAPLPALPPIALGSILAYLLSIVILHQ